MNNVLKVAEDKRVLVTVPVVKAKRVTYNLRPDLERNCCTFIDDTLLKTHIDIENNTDISKEGTHIHYNFIQLIK